LPYMAAFETQQKAVSSSLTSSTPRHSLRAVR